MTKFIVELAHTIEASKRYKRIKNFAYNILENNSYRYKKFFDSVMIFLVLSTVAILIYEINHKKDLLLYEYEFFAIIVFLCEYLARFWVYSDCHKIILNDYEKATFYNKEYKFKNSLKAIISSKMEFVTSPMAIIDLLAILPYYRALRILRIFLIFRLFKILRYSNSIKEFLHVVKERKFELYTLGFLYIIVVFFGSTIMFIYEGPKGINPNINQFSDAIYWSVISIATVGYGDIIPVTTEGRIITMILVVFAFLLIAFGTSIITTGLSDRMEKIKENRIEAEASKMKDFVIICGFEQMAKYFCEQMTNADKKFIIMDIDKHKIEEAKSLGYLAITSDATNMHILESIGLNNGARSVIIFTSNDAVNLSIVLSVRALNNDIEIISRVSNPKSVKKFYVAGVSDAILFNEITALVGTQYLGKPVSFKALDGILLNRNEDVVIDEIKILDEYNIYYTEINSIDFDKYELTVLGVINSKNLDNFIFNPLVKRYMLTKDDILIVIGFDFGVSQLKADLINQVYRVKV